ncbi:hypothetical protein [Parvularcula lutaonensis]|uniref:Uncharacterized protein n=1 Tax=Parvularcula lutaonensis TaxID=491923 RepID=A0ABV7MCW3_9PROT|nr:hypothetical protein [Parvularcula lutaonensis]GGY47471.1 hypothetical protein GCM10007148_16040 [Parvularcula lutaonensis]
MREAESLTFFAILSLAGLAFSEAPQLLLDWLSGEPRLSFGGSRSPGVILANSWLGWGAGVLMLRLTKTGREYLPMALHPATLTMTAGGLGLAATALLSIFISIEKVQRSGSAQHVALIGAAFLAATLFIPRFELLLLAFASPLFLIAPKAMIDRHMTSFYVVVLFPALVSLGFLHLLQGAPPDAGNGGATLVTAGVPTALAGPAAAFLLALAKSFRLAAALLVASLGVILAPTTTPLWPLMIVGLAAAFVLHRRVSLVVELALAGSLMVASAALTSQMVG